MVITIGGLVGHINVYQASIFNSFSTSSVTGNFNVAGLVGLNTQTEVLLLLKTPGI